MVMSPGVAAPADIWSCDRKKFTLWSERVKLEVLIVVILHDIIKNSSICFNRVVTLCRCTMYNVHN